MPATVIPVKGLYLGFVGNISNEGYSLRTPRLVQATDQYALAFGETAVLNANNTYSSVKSFLYAGVGNLTALTALGIAASNVNINSTYASQGGQNITGGFYPQGTIADVLVQGTINVSCYNGTPIAGGNVYMRTALDTAVPSGVIGGLEAAADADSDTTATLTTTINSTAAVVSSATGLVVGMPITAAGVALGTFIAAIAGTAVTLSQNATASETTEAAVFSHSFLLTNLKWKTGYLETDDTCQVTILQRTIA